MIGPEAGQFNGGLAHRFHDHHDDDDYHHHDHDHGDHDDNNKDNNDNNDTGGTNSARKMLLPPSGNTRTDPRGILTQNFG